MRQYWARNLADVTKQCSRDNLIPSLLFKDSEFPTNRLFTPRIASSTVAVTTDQSLESVTLQQQLPDKVEIGVEEVKLTENNKMLNEIKAEKAKIIAFQEEINTAVKKLEQVFIARPHALHSNLCFS